MFTIRHKELIEKYPELRNLILNTYIYKETYYRNRTVHKLFAELFNLIDKLDKETSSDSNSNQ